MSKSGKLFIISGPSGAGKGTVCEAVLREHPEIALSVSVTTRAPREHETEGVSYYFVSKERFLKMIDEGALLEYSCHFENYYGTPKEPVLQNLQAGRDVILEIDVNGALQVKKNYQDSILIFVLPPDRKVLRKRLTDRGTETPEQIEERLQRFDFELSNKQRYDYTVVNDVLSVAVRQVEEIMEEYHD